jgi:hypothetical protein
MVEYLPGRHKVLNSNSNTTKKKKKGKREILLKNSNNHLSYWKTNGLAQQKVTTTRQFVKHAISMNGACLSTTEQTG